MRMALGLVSLLVVLGIVMLLFNFYQAPMLKQGKTMRDDAQQLAGRDENNEPVHHAVTLDAQDRAGKMEAAVVTGITAGSTLETHYGLQKGDVIVELGQVTVKGNIHSADEAKDFLLYAYQRNEPVVVLRGGERLSLPMPAPARNAAATAGPSAESPSAAADGTQPPAQEQPAPKKPAGGLEGQLDLIRNAGGQ
jgi:hypothetical protein